MTGPQDPQGTGPISVAELLARNGTLGAPAVTRRRRRRRGDSESVTVAELTGEIPVVRGDGEDEIEHETNGTVTLDEPPAPARPEPLAPQRAAPEGRPAPERDTGTYWSEPEPRWPKSPPQPVRGPGPERSAYPRPLRHDHTDAEEPSERGRQGRQSGAEGMSPDPFEHYADLPVDVMDSEVREAEPVTEDSAYVRSFLQGTDGTLFGGQTLADEVARRRSDERADAREAGFGGGQRRTEDHHRDTEAEHADEDARAHETRLEALWRGGLIVLQSILAVAFGGGLFIAFDQLWRWNSLVALVLSVLVILGLVAGVRVVRKTEDIASTLIAVAVGALITFGPLALSLQSG